MFADQSEALDAAGGGNSLEDLLTRCFDFAFGLILQRRLIINSSILTNPLMDFACTRQ